MRLTTKRGVSGFGLGAALMLLATGCGEGANKTGQAKEKAPAKGAVHVAEAKKDAHKDHDQAKEEKSAHSGWWCDEHGIPEDECSMCSSKVAKACKAKGDWCDKHDRAKSQCFICDPKLKEKYAAVYRAKLGKEPPPTEDEEKKGDEKKDDKKDDKK